MPGGVHGSATPTATTSDRGSGSRRRSSRPRTGRRPSVDRARRRSSGSRSGRAMPARSANGDEVRLHLRPRREVRACRPSARAGSRASPARRRAGCSSRSARRRACRARPARAAWSTTGGAGRTASGGTSRRATDRPRSPRGRRRDARSEYETWRRAGAAADDDDRVLAGRERAGSAPPSVRGPQPAGLGLEHPVHHPRVGDQERLDARAGQDEAAQRPGRDDVGDRRLAEDDRHLAEELAAAEPRALRAVDDDRPPRRRG